MFIHPIVVGACYSLHKALSAACGTQTLHATAKHPVVQCSLSTKPATAPPAIIAENLAGCP